jgi:hypothetical protein
MGGGLMQLVAYGAQDFYLTGNAQITFFKVVYRRHTNFAVESIEQTFNGSTNWNSRAVCNLQRSGDLVTKMYLRLTLPSLNIDSDLGIVYGQVGQVNKLSTAVDYAQWAWVSRLGHFMLSDAIMEIGGTQIDKLYGDWLNVWYELARNFAHDRGYGEMIGDTPELTTLSGWHDQTTLYIPLQFACCRNDGLALPVIALQYHDIKITVDFAPFENLVNYNGRAKGLVSQMKQALQIQNCSLFVDYVYLDNEERKRFAQASHEYLFEQLQFTGSETVSQYNSKYRLNLNHPCKELVWNASSGRYWGNSFLAYDPSNVNLALVNATKRFVLRCAKYTTTSKLAKAGDKLDFNNGNVSGGVNYSGNDDVSFSLGSGVTQRPVKIKTLFEVIDAVCLTDDPDIDNITILGRLLTVQEFSVPSDVMFKDFKVNDDLGGDGSDENDVTVWQWDNYGCYLDGSRNPSSQVLLQLNGHDRFSQREGAYFNYVQPWQCHTNTPADGINVYSFALNPEQHQPSGTCNFSRIDNATINVQYDSNFDISTGSANFNIYATNYNVLRVMSGMGGLAYSN